MEAIRCNGLTDADGEKSSGGRIEFPNGELLAEVEPVPKTKPHYTSIPNRLSI